VILDIRIIDDMHITQIGTAGTEEYSGENLILQGIWFLGAINNALLIS
jgi:hypothetical protein